MSRCERYESEALLLLEQGLPLGEHFSTCPDCRAARSFYERLQEGLAAMGEEDQPEAGWQGKVWERIEQRRGRHRWWAWWGLVPAALAASVAAFFLLRTPAPAPVFLEARVESGSAVKRGEDVQPGDLLHLEASTGGAPHAELRVYRNDAELILACSSAQPCSREGAHLEATLVLEGVGRYQPLLLFSKSPLPRASNRGLDADMEAAFATGARVELGLEITAR